MNLQLEKPLDGILFRSGIGVTLLIVLLLAGCQPGAQSPIAPTNTLPSISATPTVFQPAPTESAATLSPEAQSPYPQNFPDAQTATWSPVFSGLQQPLDIQSTAIWPDIVLIVEKAGRIVCLNRNSLQIEATLLDIRGKVATQGNEQGLLGLALPPNFATDARIYVNYTDVDGNTQIARYTVDLAQMLADPQSEEILLSVEQLYTNHNGGAMAFGPDGFLYIGLGDGGSAGDPAGNAQNLQSLLGKILRLDVSAASGYALPSDIYFQSPQRAEIWLYGLRNPWRFSFDPLTGMVFIADVGQDAWEELNILSAASAGGTNLGWNAFEGDEPYGGKLIPPDPQKLVFPAIVYDHQQGCSITGGLVYRGQALPDWQGVYFYGDFCRGTIWGAIPQQDGSWRSTALTESGARISTFGKDAAGEIYFTDYASGSLFRFQPAGTGNSTQD